MSEQQQAHPTTTESELIAVRRDKLAKIRELGIDPYGARFDVTTPPAGVKAEVQEDKQLAVAGRLLAIREDVYKRQHWTGWTRLPVLPTGP